MRTALYIIIIAMLLVIWFVGFFIYEMSMVINVLFILAIALIIYIIIQKEEINNNKN